MAEKQEAVMTAQETAAGTAGAGGASESRRDRVRRRLLDRLDFRFPKSTDADAGQRFLDGLADELGYLSDRGLEVLRGVVEVKGEGSARCFWPSRATFLGFAQLVEPRPVEELPALRRWFASVEGPKAQAEGTLVETWEYFRRNRVPPVSEGARRRLYEEAEANKRRLRIVREKQAAGHVVAAEDAEWARAYAARCAYVAEIVTIEQDRKGAA